MVKFETGQQNLGYDCVYLYASVGAGQLGELNTASIVHIP